MSEIKHEKSCGAIVLRTEDGKPGRLVLLIRQYEGGPVSFPKGHVEPGETEKETAIREVFEETSVKIRIECDFRKTVHYSPAPGAEKEVVYFLGTTEQKSTSPNEGEIAEVFWADVRRASAVLEHENDRRVLDAALGYAEKNGFTGDGELSLSR